MREERGREQIGERTLERGKEREEREWYYTGTCGLLMMIACRKYEYRYALEGDSVLWFLSRARAATKKLSPTTSTRMKPRDEMIYTHKQI